jgi:hypothetical protein
MEAGLRTPLLDFLRISSDILRATGQTRAWMKNDSILASLVKNPKTRWPRR